MVAEKARIVIIGAGMAGLTAANKLYTASAATRDMFELCVVEGGSRIGGRINSSEFGGDRIEMGATWIHGIGDSPIHKIAEETRSLESKQPWECMDGSSSDDPTTVAEGGFKVERSIVDSITNLFNNLMDYARNNGKFTEASKLVSGSQSLGSFLRQGLEAYWGSMKERDEELKGYGSWSRKLVEEAIFAMHENIQRTDTSAYDLMTLDYKAESEYRMFLGEEITIAKGYLRVIESLASVLPPGCVQLGRTVSKIEWQPERQDTINGYCCSKPVKLHFCDGTVMSADHVIVTVSLGVLKAAIRHEDSDSGMFCPPLPSFKTEAISRLGFGVVNKLFLQLSQQDDDKQLSNGFPYLQMVFHPPDSELRHKKIPWWMRRTSSLCPIYNNSRVLLSWFAGEEALALESLEDEDIISGVSTTLSSFLSNHRLSNGNMNSKDIPHNHPSEVKISKVLKSKWGTDPLFLGSYSYVTVGSSGDDLDKMAEPLPKGSGNSSGSLPPLQILFAGEATHRTHYSTTHGAYFSGLREANRLLQHYHCVVGIHNNY